MDRLARLEDALVATLPPHDRWRARALARFALAIAPWGASFAVVFAALGQAWVAGSLAIAAAGVGSAPLVARTSGSLALGAHALCAALAQSLVVGAWWLGGVEAACVPWLGACVIVATLVAGRAAGVAWALVASGLVWAVFAAQAAHLLPAPGVAPVALAGVAAAAHGGLFLVVLVLVVAASAVNDRARAELDLARMAAEQANAAKSDFLARMSHELRTPLNAILGYAELLQEDAGPEVARDLGHIHGAGQHLLAVIGDVLDLAKVEAGRMAFERRPVVLADLLRSVATSAAPLVAVGRNHLELEVEDGVAALADELRLRQCVINLVSNAAKFTSDGRLRIVGRAAAEVVVLEVHDTGVGMTAEQLGRVFEPFAQATDDVARTHGGTGRGLASVRQFTERMGGAVSARSTPGRGSVFVLELPRATPAR